MNVVISGTSSGIGLASAQLFCERGHAVFGFDVQEPAFVHPSYKHIVHDVRNELPPEAENPPLAEVVVCNAGVQDEEQAIAVNLEGAMRFVESFVESPALKSVVFVASACARNGSEFPRYVASKAGLVGYMKNLALSLAPRGVLCNSVSPGGVVTPANAHILESEDLYRAVRDETLLGKWAQPEELAELIYYLAVVNRSIVGEDILVDNGEMLKSNFIW